MAQAGRVFACILAFALLTTNQVHAAESKNCDCKLGFTTYFVQTFMLGHVQGIQEDADCEAFITTCSQYCLTQLGSLLTAGANTILKLRGKEQSVGDYLCSEGGNTTPVTPSSKNLGIYMSIWSCGIPKQVLSVVDDNFCCDKALKYKPCDRL